MLFRVCCLLASIVVGASAQTATLTPRAAPGNRAYPATNHLAFSPDGRVLAYVNRNSVNLIDPATGTSYAPNINSGALTLAFSPDGKTLACAGAGSVAVYDVVNKRIKGRIPSGHTWFPAFTADGKTLWTTGNEGKVRKWDIGGATIPTQATAEIDAGSFGNLCVAISPDGKTLATSGRGNEINLWNPDTKAKTGRLRGHTDEVPVVAFTPDGKLLMSCSRDTKLRFWDAQEMVPALILHTHTKGIWNMVVSADGKLVATAAYDSTVRLWHVEGKRLLAAADAGTGLICVTVSPDNKTLVAVTDAGLKFWDIALRP